MVKKYKLASFNWLASQSFNCPGSLASVNVQSSSLWGKHVWHSVTAPKQEETLFCPGYCPPGNLVICSVKEKELKDEGKLSGVVEICSLNNACFPLTTVTLEGSKPTFIEPDQSVTRLGLLLIQPGVDSASSTALTPQFLCEIIILPVAC